MLYLFFHRVEIVRRFFEICHTQNQGDSMHAMIEKTSKGKTIFVTSDWVNVIQSAKTGKNPYKVTQIQQNSIFDFKAFAENQNWDEFTIGLKIKLSNVRELRTNIYKNNIVQFKYEFDGDFYELNVNERKGRPLRLETFVLRAPYSKPFPLSKGKIKDLMPTYSSGTIPSSYHAFYESLQSKADDTQHIVTENDD